MKTELCDLDASKMRWLMRRGEVSPVSILELYSTNRNANFSVNDSVSML